MSELILAGIVEILLRERRNMTPKTATGSVNKTRTRTHHTNSKRRRRKSTKKPTALRGRPNPPENPHEKTCIQADPMPEDFVFVRKGDPYITRNCKSRSKDAASTVYIVYDNKEQAQLGIRVRKDIYKAVTETAHQTAQNRAAAVQIRDARDQRKAKLVLSETFPGMPDACVEEVLQHAFLKGSGRVGRTATRPEKVKATLAVEAYIRHKNTLYELLLRQGMDRESARESVWESVKGIRDTWAETT